MSTDSYASLTITKVSKQYDEKNDNYNDQTKLEYAEVI